MMLVALRRCSSWIGAYCQGSTFGGSGAACAGEKPGTVSGSSGVPRPVARLGGPAGAAAPPPRPPRAAPLCVARAGAPLGRAFGGRRTAATAADRGADAEDRRGVGVDREVVAVA